MKKLTLLLLIVLAFFSCNTTQDKFIGLQLWSVRDDMKKAPEETIVKVGEIGYSFVEAAGYADGKFYGIEPADFKALVEKNNMVFLSSHTGQNMPDSANWENTMAWWDTCIDAHVAAGVKFIVQPFMGGAGYDSIAGLKAYCDYFNAVGEKCNEKGIRFGYHNHSGEFAELEGEVIYDYMLQNTDPDKVMFQLDLYWIKEGGGDPVAYFNKYPGRFELYHVKDKTELSADGEMDFVPAFENAEKAGMKYYIVEVEEYNFEPIVSVEKSYEYLVNAPFAK